MHRAAAVSSVVVAFLLALPLPAIAGQAQSQAEHTVTGTVVYVGPVAFAVDTGTKIETFRIPPGADWAETIVPNARVTLNWKAAPAESSRVVVRVDPAAANVEGAPTSGSVVGHVAFIDPAEMAVKTARGIDLFAFEAGAPRPRGLVAGDDVRVWYTIEPGTARGVVTRTVAQRSEAAGHRSTRNRAPITAQAGRIRTATGAVAMINPDFMVVDTGKRLQEFAINRASRVGDIVPGDEVSIRYEKVIGAQEHPVIASYPAILHTAS